jgi:hypothetical protein
VAEVAVRGEAAEVARAETQAVLSMLVDEERRARLADVVAALDGGSVGGDEAEALAELLELGLTTGRVRALYGPGGEQAVRSLYRRLPPGRALTDSTAELSVALETLAGRTLEHVRVIATGPGEYGVAIAADGLELEVRLGRSGARLATIGADG